MEKASPLPHSRVLGKKAGGSTAGVAEAKLHQERPVEDAAGGAVEGSSLFSSMSSQTLLLYLTMLCRNLIVSFTTQYPRLLFCGAMIRREIAELIRAWIAAIVRIFLPAYICAKV